MPDTITNALTSDNHITTTFSEEHIDLAYREGSSDKVYNIDLSQCENGWSVTAQRGRRSSTLITERKALNVDYQQAKTIYDRLVREKTAKGYRDPLAGKPREPSEPVAPALTSSRERVSDAIVFNPELLTRVTCREAGFFAAMPRYLLQVKQDGERLAIRNDAGNIYGFNKLGFAVKLDPQLYATVKRLCEAGEIDQLLMDGEWEADGWHGWDLLICKRDLREQPYSNRLAMLSLLLSDLAPEFSLLHLTYTAYTDADKGELLANRTIEGVCIKDREAPYAPGRNGQHKKYKFEQFASFIVGPKPKPDGKRSVGTYIVDATAEFTSDWRPLCGLNERPCPPLRYVGSVGVPEKYPLPADGAIIDVRYLYAYPGGGVAQAKYFGKIRTDVRYQDCTTAQFKFKKGAE